MHLKNDYDLFCTKTCKADGITVLIYAWGVSMAKKFSS